MFYNRLSSVYGKNFSGLSLERIKWESYSGDILELFLFEIKNTKFNSSEIVADFAIFEKMLRKEISETKQELQIVFSNSGIFSRFSKTFDFLFSSYKNKNTDLSKLKIRLLVPKNKKVFSFFEKPEVRNNGGVEINYIHENSIQYLIVVIDKVASIFSEMIINNKNPQHSTYFNVISTKNSLIWYNTAVFESLWKQSILENKVKNLSLELNRNNISNHNFVRILAHELKNPIQPILGFSDMMQNNTRLNSEQKNELLKIISRNARKLDIMTNNILDYARMENNIFNLNIEPFDIVKITEDLLGDYILQVNNKNIKIDLTYSYKPLVIQADKIRITEVLDNLISNSIKFTEKGRIDISIRKMPQYLEVKISDTGCGINENEAHKLFTKFFTTDKLGTGLGLYISKLIMEKHRGRIEGRNNNNGVGSIFSFELPTE
jgi:signal transduction histidine kinase